MSHVISRLLHHRYRTVVPPVLYASRKHSNNRMQRRASNSKSHLLILLLTSSIELSNILRLYYARIALHAFDTVIGQSMCARRTKYVSRSFHE